MKKIKGMNFESYFKKKIKDKEIKIEYDEAAMHLKIACLLEQIRTKLKLTQAELAEKTGVSQPMIARLERGDQNRIPTLTTINKIFRALGYEVDLIITKVA